MAIVTTPTATKRQERQDGTEDIVRNSTTITSANALIMCFSSTYFAFLSSCKLWYSLKDQLQRRRQQQQQ